MEQKSFYVDTVLLIRESPVLRKMLQSGMEESRTKKIRCPQFSSSSFMIFLELMQLVRNVRTNTVNHTFDILTVAVLLATKALTRNAPERILSRERIRVPATERCDPEGCPAHRPLFRSRRCPPATRTPDSHREPSTPTYSIRASNRS